MDTLDIEVKQITKWENRDRAGFKVAFEVPTQGVFATLVCRLPHGTILISPVWVDLPEITGNVVEGQGI